MKEYKKIMLIFHIASVMRRSTKPQTGYDIFQKIKNKKTPDGRHVYHSLSGDEICGIMISMEREGVLRIVGEDFDCGFEFELNE